MIAADTSSVVAYRAGDEASDVFSLDAAHVVNQVALITRDSYFRVFALIAGLKLL
jgi:hypothetical protein